MDAKDFLREMKKARNQLVLKNQPGKTAPRYWANIRNLGRAAEIAKEIKYDIQPVIDQAHESFHALLDN